MLPIRILLDVNSKISFLIGGILNVLLIWLILKKTPKEMRIYSKILLQVCVSDLANLVVNDSVQPLVLISNGITMCVSCGVAGKLPYPWNAIAYHVWFYFAYFAMLSIVVQFAYRYLVLCKMKKSTALVYFALLVLACLMDLALFGALWLIAAPSPDDHVQDPQIIEFLGENPNELYGSNNISKVPSPLRMVLRGESSSPLWIGWHLCFGGMPILGYAFVMYSGLKMMKFVDVNMFKPNGVKTTREELNRQITLNLMVQACIPLVAIFCWGACAYVCIFGRVMNVDWFNQFSSLTATPIQCWISVFNPLATILTVMPYRRAVLGGILPRRRYSNGITATSGFGGTQIAPANQLTDHRLFCVVPQRHTIF